MKPADASSSTSSSFNHNQQTSLTPHLRTSLSHAIDVLQSKNALIVSLTTDFVAVERDASRWKEEAERLQDELTSERKRADELQSALNEVSKMNTKESTAEDEQDEPPKNSTVSRKETKESRKSSSLQVVATGIQAHTKGTPLMIPQTETHRDEADLGHSRTGTAQGPLPLTPAKRRERLSDRPSKQPLLPPAEVIVISSDEEEEDSKHGVVPSPSGNVPVSHFTPCETRTGEKTVHQPTIPARTPESWQLWSHKSATGGPKQEGPVSQIVAAKRSPSPHDYEASVDPTSIQEPARKRRRLSEPLDQKPSTSQSGPDASTSHAPPSSSLQVPPVSISGAGQAQAVDTTLHDITSTFFQAYNSDLDFDGELTDLTESEDEEESEVEVIGEVFANDAASLTVRRSSRPRPGRSRLYVGEDDIDMADGREPDDDYVDPDNQVSEDEPPNPRTASSSTRKIRAEGRPRPKAVTTRKRGGVAKTKSQLEVNLSTPSGREKVQAFHAILYPPPPSTNDPLIPLLYERVRTFPVHHVSSFPSSTDAKSNDPIAVSRRFIANQYHSPNCTFFADIRAEHNVPRGTPRAMFFPEYNQNPGLPDRPGAPGTLISVRKELSDKGPIFTIWAKVKPNKHEGQSKVRWMYYGNYETTKSLSPLSGKEFCMLDFESQKVWIYNLCKSKLSTDSHLATRLMLRYEGRDREAEDTGIVHKESISRLQRGSVDDFLKVWQAMRDGKDHLNVWTLRCVGYDEDFARDLAVKSAKWKR